MDRYILEESLVWARLLAIAAILVVGLITWAIGRWAGRRLKGTTRLGLRSLERLAAPIALLVALLVTWRILKSTPHDPPILEATIELLLVGAGFWLGARALDVIWSTGSSSARIRHQPGARSMLLAGRQLGKAALALGLIAVYSIRLGVAEQLYIALGAIGAALTFAARAPIANAVSFAEMVLAPPFHIGDRVRIEHYRGGAPVEGEVVAISLSATTVRTRSRSEAIVANSQIDRLRVENLSRADRRRLELSLPIAEKIPAEKLRSACESIEEELRESKWVSEYRAPHVWISGYSDGLVLKASVWLQQGSDRRDAQRDLYVVVGSRFEELTRSSRRS